MKHHQHPEAERFVDFVRVLVTRSALAGAVGLGMAVACGAPLEGDGNDLTGAQSEALQVAGQPAASVYWDGPQALGPVTGATGTPALASRCAAALVAFTRVSSNNRFRGVAAGELGPSAWADYAPRAFASSPSVTALPNDCNGHRFLIVGRGTGSTAADRRIYWSEGRATQNQGAFNAPQATTIFAEVSAADFTGDNGYPAVTSSPNGDALLVYRNGSTIYGHTKFVGATNWSAAHTAPALPSGWTPIGTPAIEFSFANNATVIVRGQSGASVRFFRIFYNNGFGDPLGPIEWDPLPLPAGSLAIQSDPALEWNDALWTHTVYYRNDKTFYQASIFYNTWEHVPKPVVNTVTTPEYVEAPAVNGNADYEQLRTHWVLGRSGTQLHFSVIMEGDPNLEP